MDCRDNTTYKTVSIGGQIWMAENLKFNYDNGNGSYCSPAENCKNYGRLYNWTSATKACLEGWHLPTDQEWQKLEAFAGMTAEQMNKIDWRGTIEGTKLKASNNLWITNNGSDALHFSALPGGMMTGANNTLYDVGYKGYWWTSTESIMPSDAFHRGLSGDQSIVLRWSIDKTYGYSVRCVKTP